jgi:hypothetical protein
VSTLFFDTGAGWNTNEQVTQRVLGADREFALSFELPPGVAAHTFRWDPVELRTCRVHLAEIEITDRSGRTPVVDPEVIQHNGERLPDGAVSFASGDPTFWWPATGDEARVRVRGSWQFDDALRTILTQSERIHELTHQLGKARREMESVYRSPSWRWSKPLRLAGRVARRLKAS